VVCSDINETAARATADAIVADGGQATSLRCDVAQVDDVALLAKEAQDWFGGPPTLVINNAGVGAGGHPIGEVSLDDWNWVLGINLWGPIHGCHVFAPILREAGYGGIINSHRPRPSVRRQAWRRTTSARQACCRCRKPWRPN
jgi:NAD(P)-dependent dehydrogenase (short-subunit alcohol dehydrogenase family)